MSRDTPIPVVTISSNTSMDSESGVTSCNVIIDVESGEYGCGFIVLDEPGDLHILRNAIDEFINTNNIKNPFL